MSRSYRGDIFWAKLFGACAFAFGILAFLVGGALLFLSTGLTIMHEIFVAVVLGFGMFGFVGCAVLYVLADLLEVTSRRSDEKRPGEP